jgi:hypothetical protein
MEQSKKAPVWQPRGQSRSAAGDLIFLQENCLGFCLAPEAPQSEAVMIARPPRAPAGGPVDPYLLSYEDRRGAASQCPKQIGLGALGRRPVPMVLAAVANTTASPQRLAFFPADLGFFAFACGLFFA